MNIQYHFVTGSVLFFITMFVMEPSSDKDEINKQQSVPRVMYEGHDNKVFVGDGLPQPQFTHPQSNGTTNPYYPNGNAQTNEDIQPTYRVIENSRL